MSHDNKNSGFTLVELAMAMAFVSMLLILITMTVIQISNIYNRGITVKEVNQVGRSLIDDIKRTISQSAGFEVNPVAADAKYIKISNAGVLVSGRLCTGSYSYVWNLGKAIVDNKYLNKYASPSTKIISLVKVPDINSSMCTLSGGNYPNVNESDGVELLNAGDRRLALHNFNISLVEKDNTTSQQLYRIEFMLGTNNQEEIVSDQCKATGNSSDSSYCALNKFTLTVRAGNKSS